MSDEESFVNHAAELRKAFDASFANPPRTELTTFVDLLAIRVGTDAYAVRVSDISGLFADRPVAALPGPVPDLIGISGFRGALVPVYALRSLLGYTRTGPSRWMLVVAGAAPVALCFEGVEGHLRVPEAAVAQATGPTPGREHVRDIVTVDGALRPIIHIPAIIEAIRERARRSASRRER